MDLQTTQLGSDSVQLKIVIEPFEGPIRGLTLNLERDVVIGRDAICGVQLDGRLVSRRHAIVRATPDGLTIEDISSNGTLVDGTLLKMAIRRVACECVLIVGCARLWLRRH